MNACWRKNMFSFTLKLLQCAIKEKENLGKLTDFQMRWNNPFAHLL